MKTVEPTKLAIFDFDGTLINTSTPENGKVLWEKEFLFEWPFNGWWGRPESLDSRIYFDKNGSKLIEELSKKLNADEVEMIIQKGFSKNIFKNELISDTISAHVENYDKPGILTFMMTGRIPKLSKYVENILNNQNKLKFNDYYYNNTSDTLSFKKDKINEFIKTYPTINFIEMWDDRLEHISEFKGLGDEYPHIEFKINHVIY